MKLNKLTQIHEDCDPTKDVDLVIACCGYEKRCSSLMQFYGLSLNNVKTKKALLFKNPPSSQSDINRKTFEDFGFQMFEVIPDEDYSSRILLIDKLFDDIKELEDVRILVDFTSMNREWYSAVLIYLERYLICQCKRIECRFYYRIPIFKSTKDDKYAFSNIHPLRGFSQFTIPDKPLALIIGLGSEERALNGIWQYADVDPNYVHYFYTKNEHIFNNNSNYAELLNKIDESQKHEYSLDRLVPLFNSLCDLYSLLSEENRVTIISCGPKPFTLISLVFAKLYNVDVWKLETNVSDHIVDKEASTESILFSFEYRQKL